MHANVSAVGPKVYYNDGTNARLLLGQILLLCPVRSTFLALVRQFTVAVF